MTQKVVITGLGLVSSLGEGHAPHLALADHVPEPEMRDFAGTFVHPAPPINFDTQIPKKGDQRQMEMWQRLGVHTAGLALDDANLKSDAALLEKTHMIVAAGGGERDETTDENLLNGIGQTNDIGAFINASLSTNLRPTLFLAQLTNLLAGNISIVHNVTGSSRSFMGEEMAGMDALRTMNERIRHGQAEIGLVGAAYNAERKDMLLNYAFADLLTKTRAPVGARGDESGIAFGSMSAFFVLEAETHAKQRGARIHAELGDVLTTRSAREPGDIQKSLASLNAPQDAAHVLSGACGRPDITTDEFEFWAKKNATVRAIAALIGHGPEVQGLFATALAALFLGADRFPKAFSASEKSSVTAPSTIIASCCGIWRGEALAFVHKAAA